MKKEILFLAILLNSGITSINAQITIKKTAIVEKAILKPKQFDSLSNITVQKHPTDYKKYIGYKLYFLPKSKNYKSEYNSDNKERIIDFLFSNDTNQITKDGKIPFEQISLAKIYKDRKNDFSRAALEQYSEKKRNYENIDKAQTNIYLAHFYHERTRETDGEIFGKIGTLPDSVYGKYFTIVDIKGKELYGSKEYKKLEDADLDDGSERQLSLKITLRNESNRDILYWIVGHRGFTDNPFFLVPYFEKKRSKYLNQNLVLRYGDRIHTKLQNLIDVNTGATINIRYGEVWTCSDISFIDSKDSYYLSCFYFLKNGEREVKIKLGSGLVNDYFMLETEFKQQELEKQKKEEQRLKEQQAREKQEQQERIRFRNECIAKWGQKIGGYIADGNVVLGMNKEMCTAAWGSPIDINRTIVGGLTSDQWVYGWGTYLYFDNGVLSAIQD